MKDTRINGHDLQVSEDHMLIGISRTFLTELFSKSSANEYKGRNT